jgi:hypothetical protein
MDNGDPSFPSSRFLGVACVIVPKGTPPPLEWMAAHPNYVTVRGVIIPRAPLALDMELEPRPESEGQAEPLPEKPTYRVEIDYAGNWIIKGVTVMMPRPAPQPDPPSAAEADRLFEVGYRAGRKAAQSPAGHARTDRRVKAVAEAIIAQARADDTLTEEAGAAALELNPAVEVATVAALAALGVVAAVEAEPPQPYVPARSFHGFEPPPPSPPLPGLVPPPSPQRKPGEGGFTPAPPTPPSPGFTPSPPSAPVHPGRPAEANKPIIVSHSDKPDKPAAKGPLPPARADARGVRRYNPDVSSHAKAAAAEAELAAKVHGMPDQQVVVWGGPIGSHGADVISVDTRTGAVTLWDAKYRSENVKVGASKTFEAGKDARDNAIRQAIAAIRTDKTLSPEIRDKALKNLEQGKVRTITTGFGNTKNSAIGK